MAGWSTKLAKLSKFAVWSSDAKPLLKLPWKLYYSSGEKMRKHSLHDNKAGKTFKICSVEFGRQTSIKITMEALLFLRGKDEEAFPS
jgi:hypothetical protein